MLGKLQTYKLQPTKFYEKGHWPRNEVIKGRVFDFDVFVNQLVRFSAGRERWMTSPTKMKL